MRPKKGGQLIRGGPSHIDVEIPVRNRTSIRPIMRTTPHRFHQFKPPTHGPLFDQPASRWPTFVGEFLAPVVRDSAVEAFVFLDHQPKDFEFRFASKEFKRVEDEMAKRQEELGIESIAKPTNDAETIAAAFGGGRFLAPDKLSSQGARELRSELIFRFLHAGCALYLDNLAKDGARWRIEANFGEGQNPLGNTFESMLHLISNFSGAQFDVFVMQHDPKMLTLATAWMLGCMPNPRPPSVKCYL